MVVRQRRYRYQGSLGASRRGGWRGGGAPGWCQAVAMATMNEQRDAGGAWPWPTATGDWARLEVSTLITLILSSNVSTLLPYFSYHLHFGYIFTFIRLH